MMEKKRSIGVTVFGILTIVFSLLNITGWDYKGHSILYQSLPALFTLFLYGFVVLYVPVGIALGIGILRLNNNARKIAIILTAITVFLCIIVAFQITGHKEFFLYQYEKMNASDVVAQSIFINQGFVVTYILYLLTIIYEVVYIYFFTRPKVKEQFK